MARFWRAAAIVLVLCVALVVGHRTASAHPHVWIDLRTTVVLDAEGRVTAIDQEWLFDPIYSAYAVAGADPESDAGRQALADLVAESMRNLHPYDYFSRVRVDGARQAFERVREYAADLREGRLLYRFTLPLAEPVDPAAHDVDVAVFDPTYYIEMLHLEGDVVAFSGANPAGCGARIIAPTPDMETVVFARSLDRGAPPDDTLGAQFAELVVVTCG